MKLSKLIETVEKATGKKIVLKENDNSFLNKIKNLDSFKTYYYKRPKRGGFAPLQRQDLKSVLNKLNISEEEKFVNALNNGKNVQLTWMGEKGRSTHLISNKKIDMSESNEEIQYDISQLSKNAIIISGKLK